jgi:acrylyl-CoA reductase (NADPH)
LAAPGKPLQKERFAGVVDALGSQVLVNACAQVKRNGAVAACGLAMGMDFRPASRPSSCAASRCMASIRSMPARPADKPPGPAGQAVLTSGTGRHRA